MVSRVMIVFCSNCDDGYSHCSGALLLLEVTYDWEPISRGFCKDNT
jgi:hypothetical protein